MSDYRRLISYIYAYEGGEKKKNAGYAKVEVRGKECRIYVNVKNIYVGGNDLCVYLLTPQEEISLGRIFMRAGSGEFRVSVDVENVSKSSHKIEECYGLTIHEPEHTWQSYTTIWEDAVAQAAEVKATEEMSQEKMSQEKKLQEKMSQEKTPQESGGEETNAEVEPSKTEELKTEEKTEDMEESDKVPWSDKPDGLQEISEELDQLEQEEKKAQQPELTWQLMQKRYAKVQAFDYEDGCEILLIRPQDIGLLPRETWIYGNNSFLLHGYYNYRHLILARLENPQGNPRYLLGVPGHCYRPEKNMAALFGFLHFIPAKKQPEQDGRFGYWYADIRL